jgi:surface polysaccharide O-acyltransferase-like enzyme
MRLIAFDYFRGIAIIFIVAGHSYGAWQINSFAERVLANLIGGGTTLFVFISGFFFHYIFYQNFHYKTFMAKKLKNVFLPYLLFSLSGIAYYSFSSEPFPYAWMLGIENVESSVDTIRMIAIYLWTGRLAHAYWYIPFILIVFAMSPLFIQYIKLSRASRIGVFLLFLITAMFIQRPVENISPIHSVLYFTPIYMLGIICSIDRDSVIEFIQGRSVALGLIVLLLATLQAVFFEGYGNTHKASIFSYGGVDIILIQKIALCFFLLSILQRFEQHHIPALKLLASSSFAIFFIHPWLLKIFSDNGLLTFIGKYLPDIVVFFITVPLAVISSVLIAYLVKLLLKDKSRYVTGW